MWETGGGGFDLRHTAWPGSLLGVAQRQNKAYLLDPGDSSKGWSKCRAQRGTKLSGELKDPEQCLGRGHLMIY